MKKINEGKRKINNLDKPLTIRSGKKRIQIIDISNDSGDLTTDFTGKKR